MKTKKGKLQLVISVHVDDVFMDVNPETLKVIEENIKEKFNISESGKVRKFLGVYYKCCHNVKGTYTKMTMEKHVKKLVEGYKNIREVV